MSDVYARTQTGVGQTNALKLNRYGLQQAAVQVNITGTVTCQVEGTLDDVDNPPTGGVTWFAHPTLKNLTVSTIGGYGTPTAAHLPRAVRLNQSQGTGTSVLTVIQAGSAGN